MEDRPQDRPEDRRRRGPLGDEENAEETRRVPQEGRGEQDAEVTRRVSPEEADEQREAATRPEPTTPEQRRTPRRVSGGEDPETRVIRTPGAATGASSEATTSSYPLPGDYPEADERREAHLREVYGGVDWLASFIGCVLAVVSGAVLLPLVALVLGPLGFALDLERGLNAVVILGLVVVGIVLFACCLFGGYVAGRLARFDGGRNGAAMVLWGILLCVLLVFFGSLLPGALLDLLRDFMEGSVLPTIGSLIQNGLAGAGIFVGVLLVALLGGFLGGRLGNRYHTRIDQTS